MFSEENTLLNAAEHLMNIGGTGIKPSRVTHTGFLCGWRYGKGTNKILAPARTETEHLAQHRTLDSPIKLHGSQG